MGSYTAATAGSETLTTTLFAANFFLAAGQTLQSNYTLPASAGGRYDSGR